MVHRIKKITPLENYVLDAVFTDGIEKLYDIRKIYPIFPQFQDLERITGLFEKVKVDAGGYGISWNDELDLEAEVIWDNGMLTGVVYEFDVYQQLAESLVQARAAVGLTQLQLSEITGIYQADISKIERAIGNPSVKTLERLADGLGMKLKIELVKK